MPINTRGLIMSILRSRRGAGLIDVMVTLMLMSITAIVFSSAFPAGFRASSQAHDYKLATSIAQRKMEQVRGMNYESLTQPHLLSKGVIDSNSFSSPYSFTEVDKVDAASRSQTELALHAGLPSGRGTLTISDPASDTRRVTVTVTWQDASTNFTRSVQLSSLFVDKRTRRVF